MANPTTRTFTLTSCNRGTSDGANAIAASNDHIVNTIAASAREHGAQCGLRQMLSDDACPAGAERESNPHLPRSRGATRNREARHVAADEQQQTKHSAEHQQQPGAARACQFLLQWH